MEWLRKIPFRFAVNFLLTLTGLVIFFHLLVLFHVIPFQMVWGGRLKTTAEMQQFESFSIAMNSLIFWIVAMKGRKLKMQLPTIFIHAMLWIFAILFTLNTLGNLFSGNVWEAALFTPVTFISTFMFLRLVIEN